MKSNPSFTKAEADQIVLLIHQKLKADSEKQKSIRNKIRKLGFYASDYGFRDGYTVEQFLSVAKIRGAVKVNIQKSLNEKNDSIKPLQKIVITPAKRSNSDESYIIELSDEVLMQKALRQHRFDFLKGDS